MKDPAPFLCPDCKNWSPEAEEDLAAEFARIRAEEREACAEAIRSTVGYYTPGYSETMNNIQSGAVDACLRAISARGVT